MLAPLCTNPTAGTLTGLFGVVLMGFSAFGLFVVLLQKLMIASIGPIPPGPDGFDFEATGAAIHQLFLIYLPLQFAGGVIFALCGWWIYRGSKAARRIAQLAACLGIVWCAAYAWSGLAVAEKFPQPLPFRVPAAARSVLNIATMGIVFLFSASFPTGLLFVLRAPKPVAASAQP